MKPRLSAIVLAPEGLAPLVPLLHHLRAQGLEHELEVVLVVPQMNQPAILRELERNKQELNVHVVSVASCRPTGPAVAAGMLAASAELVVQCEDHSFPQPGWAKALLQAHQGPWAAVGPAVENANPGPISWADFLLSFLHWYQPPRGEAPALAGHNCSYKKNVLVAQPDLGSTLQSEMVFHHQLRDQGQHLFLEPGARVRHYNLSVATAFLDHKWLGGRIFASHRARLWPLWRRMLYAAAFPLVPVLRLHRILATLKLRPTPPLPTTTWAWLLLGLLLHAAGEAVGYLVGSLGCETAYAEYELRRFQHLAPGDLPAP